MAMHMTRSAAFGQRTRFSSSRMDSGHNKNPTWVGFLLWWLRVDSNYRPRAYESPALPLSYAAERDNPRIIASIGAEVDTPGMPYTGLMFWRWIGLISLLLILIAGVVPVLLAPKRLHGTVSQAWAGVPRWIVGPVMTLGALGVCAGIAGWIIPTYALPTFMYGVVALAFVAMLFIAWVPMHEAPGEHGLVHAHFIGGAGLATLAVVSLGTVVASDLVPAGIRILGGAGAGIAACWPVLYLTNLKRYFMVAEILIAGVFSWCLIMLFVST